MDYTFLRFPGFKKRAVTLSYDDGMVYDKLLVEILNTYGIKCTFNLNSELFAAEATDTRRRLTAEEAYKLFADGPHEIAVHGCKHLHLNYYPKQAALTEIIEDRKNLEKMFGKVVNGMAYAYGTYDDDTLEAVRCSGIKYARTVESTNNFLIPTDWLRMPSTCHHISPDLQGLIKEFLDDKSRKMPSAAPRLFYLWGHSYEFADNANWDIIENFAKTMGKRDDIWQATNGEVYEYVNAYDALEFGAAGNMVYNPTSTDVFLNCEGKEYIASAGATTVLK